MTQEEIIKRMAEIRSQIIFSSSQVIDEEIRQLIKDIKAE